MSKRKANLEYRVVFGDLHVPFHCEKTLGAIFSLIKDIKPMGVDLNGDVIDFYTVSKYSKDPQRKLTLWDELKMTKYVLKRLRKAAGDADITWLEGNHDLRLRAFIANYAEPLASLPEITIQRLLDLDSLGITYIQARSRGAFTNRENFTIGHFDRVSKHAGYTAKVLMDDHMTSIIQGHTHRLGMIHKSTIGGDYVAIESGCTCELNPSYLDTANWQQACVVLSREVGEKEWTATPIHIEDGKLFFNGKIYEGGL